MQSYAGSDFSAGRASDAYEISVPGFDIWVMTLFDLRNSLIGTSSEHLVRAPIRIVILIHCLLMSSIVRIVLMMRTDVSDQKFCDISVIVVKVMLVDSVAGKQVSNTCGT